MPKLEHEFPLDLLRHVPDLAARLLDHAADTPVPRFDRARCDAAEATTTAPPELRADSVIVLERDREEGTVPTLAIVTECQTGHDPVKQYTWPAYVTNIRARLRCPVVLLVLTPTTALANWCAKPIDAGGGYLTHRPLALALSELRPATDAEARAQPEFAILTAITLHERDMSGLRMVPPALDALGPEDAALYHDYVLAALPAAARKYLEEQVKLSDYEFKTDIIGKPFRAGHEEGHKEGVAEGMATSVLSILESRGVDVDGDDRARIMDCTDEEQLGSWLRRALTITTTDELFA